MSYLVLARKWRPRNFSEVIGQSHVVRILESAIASNRVAHAYVFSGPRGVGKTSIARILAKSLNCSEGPTSTPCEKCSSCTEIQSGSNFDVIEIDGASNNSVNDIRSLRSNVKYGPSEHLWKVYIIDEVHMLSTSAFNALLKTLEEPPPNTVFIFATTELHKLPLTVLSRCQRFDFQRLTPAEIEFSLARVSEAEGVTIEPRTLSLIARRADGGMRDAQSLLDQVLSFSDKDVKHEDVIDALGLVEQELVHALLDLIRNKDAAGAFRLSRDLSNSGADLSEYLLQVAESLRQLLLLNLEPGGSLSDLPPDQLEPLRPFSDAFSEADLLRMMHFIATSLEALKRGGQQRLRFELTLLRLVRLEQSVEVEALLKGLAGMPMEALGTLEEKKTPRVNSESSKLASPKFASVPASNATPLQPAVPPASKSTPPESQAPQKTTATPVAGSISLSVIKDAWPKVLDAIQENFPFLALTFQNFLPVLLDEKGLHLKGLYDSALGRKKLERDARALETVICEILELTPSTRVHYIEEALSDHERFMRPQSTHLDGESRMAELKREQPVVRDLFDRVGGRLLR